MKHCPSCKTNYADDTLQFCLQDGTQLVTATDVPVFDTYAEQETVIRPHPPARVVPLSPSGAQTGQWQAPPTQPATNNYPDAPKKSNTLAAVLLTALLMLVLFGAGAWLYLRKDKQVAVNVNADSPANRPANMNSANNQNQNASNNQNANTPTPTPRPTLDPKESKEITDDVKDVIDNWKNASENLDMETHLAQYADTVDYYKGGRVGISRVRADKQRAFDAYDSIDIDISNVKITPDETGDKATALFDKQWKFEAEEKYSSGKVQQLLTFARINGRWRITGEKDLKIYYVEK